MGFWALGFMCRVFDGIAGRLSASGGAFSVFCRVGGGGYGGCSPGTARPFRQASARLEETDVGRRGGRRGSQGRAQGRVRDRVRGGARRGGGGGSTGRKRGGFGMGAVEDLAGRLADRPGGGSGFSGGGSGLAGAAAGLASGGLAGRFLGGGSGEEDPGGEVTDRLALVEERLQVLEDQVQELREILGGAEPSTQDPTEPEGGGDAGSY